MLPKGHPQLLGLLSLTAVFAATSRSLADDEPLGQRAPRSYALPLGLSYLALPAFTAGAAAAFPNADTSRGVALAAGVVILGLAAPAAVHLAYNEPVRAIRSPLGTVASTVGLGLAGLGIGTILANSNCTGSAESASRCRTDTELPAAYMGALVGYVAWAVFDTATGSSTGPKNEPKVSVAPTLSSGSAGMRVVATF